MSSSRQKAAALNSEAQLRNENIADVFLCIEARRMRCLILRGRLG